MKQPRNILCDKSAATVFYKAEGGKNVQEPLPEKIMNLFLITNAGDVYYLSYTPF